MLLRALRSLFGKGSLTPVPNSSGPLLAGASSPYNPEFFTVADLEQAKALILPPEGGTTVAERWAAETAYLTGAIGDALSLNEHTMLLDYGCGVGRLSKALIDRYGCAVTGMDISPSMRQMAVDYVGSEKFSVITPDQLRQTVRRGTRADAAIVTWVLQRCPAVREDLALLKSALKKNGLLYVLNNENAAIPTTGGWFNDGTRIRQLLESDYTLVRYSRLPIKVTTRLISENTFIGVFRNEHA
jgi:SAM-dependent methyltransferase